MPVWWIASIVFHALLFGWLIFFSPIRVIDLSAKKSSNVSPERAQQIMEQVREKQAENLSQTVRDLQDIQKQLADLETRKRDEFQNFAKDFNKDAPARAEQAQAEAAKAQTDALAVQTNTATVITNALATRAAADLKQLDAQQRESIAAQNRATDAQERALEMLALSDKRFADAYKAQTEANAAQDLAAKTQIQAKSARDDAKNSKAKDRSSEIAGAQSNIAAAEKDFADATAELVTMSNTLATAQAAIASAAANTNSPPGMKAFTQAQKQADSTQRKIANKQSQLAKYAQRVIDQKARLAKFQADAAAVAPAANDEQLIALQTKAQSLQDAARESQSRARAALATAKSLPVPAESGLASLPKPAEVSPVPSTPPEEIAKMDLSKLYQTSVKTEGTLTESYRRLRATELAMIRQIPLARALELTDTAKVVRPDLQSALANTADIAASRDAVQNTRAEINAIHQLASSLLSQARELDRTGSSSPTGTPVASDNLQSATARAQTLDSLAAEDENARAKDLTTAMRRGTGSGNPGKPGTGKPAGAGTGTGGGAGNAGSPGGGTGASSGGNGDGGAGSGRGGISSGDGTSSGPPPIQKEIGAFPGRTVAASGESPRWMFVDSWYILGPFDNAGRANLEKKFPPETVVDLDATYEGKSGSKLRWEFYQAAEAKIDPPFRNFTVTKKGGLEYIIYYASTELRFAEECDLWIAIGSDDFSKVWVNDQLVWASGKQQKDWRVDEGFRKVHFQKGVNRILYRVENGHGGTLFSLVVGMN